VRRDLPTTLIREAPLALVAVTAALFGVFGARWFSTFEQQLLYLGLLTAWLFVAILLGAFAVVRHADVLAEQLGEPLGTLVLTLSVISIEVLMVTSVMLAGADNPELARDTMYAVVMIVLNGVVGMCLLLGGIRHREQQYNLQGANAFLAVIIPLAVLALVLPNFTLSASGPRLAPAQEVFLIAASLGLYAVFLAVQTVMHRAYFSAGVAGSRTGAPPNHHPDGSPVVHALLLIAYLLPLVLLSEYLAVPLEHSITDLGAPSELAGMLIALLVLSPEALGALRAALANQLQRSVNLALGSAAATIGLTVPAVLLVCLYTGEPLVLGLVGADAVLLLLTLLVSVVTFASGRTSVLQGAVHLVLFLAYVVLVFD
jgi:Ca2+:H+ antiporter